MQNNPYLLVCYILEWQYIIWLLTGMLMLCHVCIAITGLVFIFQAKEMVAISKSISTKIKDKQGDITDDEVGLC